MSSWSTALSPAAIATLATPSNRRLGAAIADEGAVEIVALDDRQAEARVGGTPTAGQRRSVRLSLTPQGLAWTCACSRRAVFCKHCVATALRLVQGLDRG